MTTDDSLDPIPPVDEETRTFAPHADPEFPHIPYPIFRTKMGSPYYISPRSGFPAFLTPPGRPPLTSEDVRRELEDFP
jgi:hypothetical protein